MCGRFTLRTSPRDLVEIFQLLREPEIAPRYNIAPTQLVLAVRQIDKFREASEMRWGLVPSWSKDPKSGPPLINARAETLASKPAFRTALSKRRCLIPADGFYEWQKGGGEDQAALLHPVDQGSRLRLRRAVGVLEGGRLVGHGVLHHRDDDCQQPAGGIARADARHFARRRL